VVYLARVPEHVRGADERAQTRWDDDCECGPGLAIKASPKDGKGHLVGTMVSGLGLGIVSLIQAGFQFDDGRNHRIHQSPDIT